MEENKDALNEEALKDEKEPTAELPTASADEKDGAVTEEEKKDDKCGASNLIPSSYVAENCIKSAPVTIEYCSDYKAYDIGDVYLESLGRLLELSLTLKRICPCKEVAIGISLTELDFFGHEHKRGFKAIRYPGHINGCHDVKIKGIRWVLPEFYDEMGSPGSICNPRKFIVRVTANYITTNVPLC